MTNKSVERSIVPHIYVDTNVFAGILEGHRASSHLLETAKEKSWKCSTTMFTIMELSEIRQDNKFIYNQLGLGTHIKAAFRLLDQKNLLSGDLGDVQERIDALFRESYPFVKFFWLEEVGWDRALELKATTNISASDCIHVATAIEAGCDVLVTLDSFLKREAMRFIKSCSPEEINKTLKDIGFTV